MQTLTLIEVRRIRTGLAILLLTALSSPNPANGAVLRFDTFPDGTPAVDDGEVLHTTPYTLGGYMFTMGFDTNDDNVADRNGFLEAAGNDGTNAFLNDAIDDRDTADAGYEERLGRFLYRTPDLAGTPANGVFILQFDGAIRPTQVSGEIWDIDKGGPGSEQWLVTAFNSVGDSIQSLESPLGVWKTETGSLDGLPWLWTMGPGAPIDRIEISFMGTKRDKIGLAFDNFTIPTPHMPEPTSSVVFVGLAAIGLVGYRSRRQRRS